MGRRLTVTDAPYPGAEDIADPHGFRHMTDAELRQSMSDAVLRLQEAMAKQDECEHATEPHEWSIGPLVMTSADICTKCGAQLNQTFTAPSELFSPEMRELAVRAVASRTIGPPTPEQVEAVAREVESDG